MGELQIVTEGTISRTPETIAAPSGAAADPTFHGHWLPQLNKDACPNLHALTVRIEGLDALTTARRYSP